MVKTEPDIVSTEKRIQHKRNRLFLTGCILLLLAGFVWIFSWMQQFELDTLHAMAINKPVNLSLGSGASIEGDLSQSAGLLKNTFRIVFHF